MSSFGARFNTATLTLTNSKISCLSKINNKQVNILHHKYVQNIFFYFHFSDAT